MVEASAAYALAQRALALPPSLPHFEIRGNSLATPAGVFRGSNGWLQKVARALGAITVTSAGYSGAVMCHATNGGTGDGGWAWILNTMHPNNYFIGSNQIENSAPNYYTKWGPKKCALGIDPGQNDVGWLGNNTNPLVEACRTIVAAYCRARTYHCRDLNNGLMPAVVFTRAGTWSVSAYGYAQALGSGCYESAVVGSTMSLTLEPDMPVGRALHFGFTVMPGDSATVTVKQNGTVVKTYTINGAVQCDPAFTAAAAPSNGVVLRTGVNGDGITWSPGDVVVLTVATITAGSVRCNYWGVETDPLDGPLVLMALPTRLPDTGYAYYAIAFSGGQGAVMSDAIMDNAAAALKAFAAEFPKRVVPLDFSSIVNTARWPMGSFSYSDGTLASGPLAGLPVQIHPNVDAYSQRAALAVSSALASGIITARMATAFSGSTAPFYYSLGGQAYWGASSLLGAGLLNGATQYTPAGQSVPTYPGYYEDLTGMVRFRGKIRPPGSGVAFAQIAQFGPVGAQRDKVCVVGTDDKWTLTNAATGGTFTITVGGQTTGAIAFGASATTVAVALGALTTVKGSANVAVTGTLAAGMAISFVNELAGMPQALTADGTNLTGGAITPVHTTTGGTAFGTIRATQFQSGLYGNVTNLIAFYSGTPSWISLDDFDIPAEG